MLSTLYMTWSESLRFFFTPDFRLYFLLIGNAALRTTQLLIRYFFWLFPLIGLTLFLMNKTNFSLKTNIFEILTICILFSLLNNFLILCTRTSLEPKNILYFLYYFPTVLFFSFLFTLIQSAFFAYLPIYSFSELEFCINIFFQIALFFFLDSQFSIKNIFLAFVRALKMLFYFLPFFIVYVSIIVGLTNLFIIVTEKIFSVYFTQQLLSLSFLIQLIFSQLFLVSTLSILYISLKHRYYKLFFTS